MKDLDLGKENIKKLLLTFCIPCVISMLINSVYNIVDQIFIGKGVGTFGNGATNVIFPLVLIFNGVAGLIGNGAAAGLSLKLGADQKDKAAKSVGQAITVTIITAIVLAIVSFILLPDIVMLFGCTENVYSYAIDYGRIIILGAPFMIFYSALANIIRADGSPRYSMNMLLIGAVINLVLDPVLIFGFHMGVKGGALATVIGQVVTAVMAAAYIRKFKSIRLTGEQFKIDSDIWNTLALGLSSFITQATVLVLFVFMNNVLTKFGAASKFGADIPLALYGVLQKINTLFISTVLGITIGAQPIIGYNYGAKKYSRVSECLKMIIVVNMIVGLLFNAMFFFFPRQLAGMFITAEDADYELFMEFAVLMCHSFLMVIALNALEMTCSTAIQALGKVKKATVLALLRQVLLLIPISLILAIPMKKGIYGILYAGAVSDSICFFISIALISTEFVLLKKQRVSIPS
ncbi:MAG: MATE family efflux transporter [Eubacteriales bacterium]|nr:MATE family efflux transporter [Eubacteriales bacterium]